MSSVMPCTRWLVVLVLLVATAPAGRAEVGVLVLEPISALGFLTRVGHAGTYFSNICPDGSPVRMRLCGPGERGGVVSKYSSLGEHDRYDWAIVPIDAYLSGVTSPDLAPLIGTHKLQLAIERESYGPLFASGLTADASGDTPDGQWKTALATRFDRSLYLFSVETTRADDALLVAAFNSTPNESQFNFFYRNCSDQAKAILDLILPRVETIGARTSGVTMQTPKGLAKSLVERAVQHPELRLRVRRFGQLPGTYHRSRPVLFPMENTYRSLGFAPWWFFGGFREVAVASMLYHEVISPFRVTQTVRDFMSPTLAQWTLEQHRLRARQDEIRQQLASPTRSRGAERTTLLRAQAAVFRRLDDIRRAKRDEVRRAAGGREQWDALVLAFDHQVRCLARELPMPDAFDRMLARDDRRGSLSAQAIAYLEARGDFSIDAEGRGPWVRVSFDDGEAGGSGLSRRHALDGDPRVAVLVLVAAIDYQLHQPADRREPIDDVIALQGLLDGIGCRPRV